jgi:Icc-related predicted phosphoesterase
MWIFGRKQRTSDSTQVRLFYSSDIHGSERCWLKFLNAAQFYNAQAIIMGGDLTGKMLVPLVEEAARLSSNVSGAGDACPRRC